MRTRIVVHCCVLFAAIFSRSVEARIDLRSIDPLIERLSASVIEKQSLSTDALLKYRLSPENPVQGQSVTVFIEAETQFDSSDEVKLFLEAHLDADSAPIELLHPTEKLWIYRSAVFTTIANHTLKTKMIIEDYRESKQIRDALIVLNQEIMRLQTELMHEGDPARRAVIQAELNGRLQQREDLQNVLLTLRKPIGEESFKFSVGGNSAPDLFFPQVAGVNPNYGSLDGQTSITITGGNFEAGARVFVGGTECLPVSYVNATTLVTTVPAQAGTGVKDLEVRINRADGGVANGILKNAFFVTTAGGSEGGALPNLHPVAFAGFSQSRKAVNTAVTLDGSISYDDNGDPLTFVWNIISKPLNSTVTDSSIVVAARDNTKASFIPDKAGIYVISLRVFDGSVYSVPSLTTVEAYTPAELQFMPAEVDIKFTLHNDNVAFTRLCNVSDTNKITLLGNKIESNLDDPMNYYGQMFLSEFPWTLQPLQCLTFNLDYMIDEPIDSKKITLTYYARNSGPLSASVVFHFTPLREHHINIEQRFNNLQGQFNPLKVFPESTFSSLDILNVSGGGVAMIPSVYDSDTSSKVFIKNSSDQDIVLSSPVITPLLGSSAISYSIPDELVVPANSETELTFTLSGDSSAVFSSEGYAGILVQWELAGAQADPIISFVVAGYKSPGFSTEPFPPMLEEQLIQVGKTNTISGRLSPFLFSSWAPPAFYEAERIEIEGSGASAFTMYPAKGFTFPLFFTQTAIFYDILPYSFEQKFTPPAVGIYEATAKVYLKGFSQPFSINLRGQGE